MNLGVLARGIIIGFAIAAPVGPIGVLCIRRTLAAGRAAGFISGLGAATADGLYGGVAAFGLTAVANLLIGQRLWLRILGGGFLLYLGARTFLAPPAAGAPARQLPLAGAYASTFLLTLTNPMTILSFAAVFAGVGLGSAQRSYASAALLVLGVFAGSTLWWLTLSAAVGRFRARVAPPALVWVNRISGTIIAAFGLAAFLGARG